MLNKPCRLFCAYVIKNISADDKGLGLEERRMRFLTWKRLVVILLSGILLISAVGCQADSANNEADDDRGASVGEFVDDSTQDIEQLKANDEKIVAYFQNVLDHADVIGVGTQEAYNTLCIELNFLFGGWTINEAADVYRGAMPEEVHFLYGNDELGGITVHDLSNEGKIEAIGIIRETYDVLGVFGDEYSNEVFLRFWGEQCLPIAEELHELYREDPRTKELKEEYFSPHNSLTYYGMYAELLLGEEAE